jgi:D-glycero-D-manno-heptose 1,7-bisphosphate phosphatase
LSSALRRAVFVDRDGTLLDERDYLDSPDDVDFIPGAIEALRLLKEAGFVIVVVTNQSGIARGLYSEGDYRAVASRVTEVLTDAGVAVDETRYCPHHPDFTGPCQCRKPGTGMHRAAAGALEIELSASFYVGDKRADVEPARALGGTGVLVRTGYGIEEEGLLGTDVRVEADLLSAARWIVASVDPDLGLG